MKAWLLCLFWQTALNILKFFIGIVSSLYTLCLKYPLFYTPSDVLWLCVNLVWMEAMRWWRKTAVPTWFARAVILSMRCPNMPWMKIHQRVRNVFSLSCGLDRAEKVSSVSDVRTRLLYRMVSGAGNLIVLPHPLRPRVAVVLLHVAKEKQKHKVPGGYKRMPGIPRCRFIWPSPRFSRSWLPLHLALHSYLYH